MPRSACRWRQGRSGLPHALAHRPAESHRGRMTACATSRIWSSHGFLVRRREEYGISSTHNFTQRTNRIYAHAIDCAPGIPPVAKEITMTLTIGKRAALFALIAGTALVAGIGAVAHEPGAG